jgi:hypothetical protein
VGPRAILRRRPPWTVECRQATFPTSIVLDRHTGPSTWQLSHLPLQVMTLISNPKQATHIGVCGLSGCMIYALDINYLLPDPQSLPMISARVSGTWIQDVYARLTDWEKHGFLEPHFAESAYAKTDRAARNTFTARHTEQLLPLEIHLANPTRAVDGYFGYYVEGLRLGPQGALSLRILVESQVGLALTARQVVHNYHTLVSCLPESLETTIAQFITYWNSMITDLALVVPSRQALMSALHFYDVWDYDFFLSHGGTLQPVSSVKELYSRAEREPAQELTAIANMDIADVESLRDVQLSQFTDSDIGTRDDELWTIGRERMTRRHPERTVSYNIAFFDDVKLATEVLIGYQCTLDFMEDWVRQQRRSLLDEILRYDDLSDLKKQDLQKRYSDVIRASQILVEPLALERGVKHAFFAGVIVRLAEALELRTNTQRSARAMADFAGLVESISGFHDAEISAKLGQLQVELASSSRRIGRIAIAIAAIGILIAGMQIYLSLHLQPQNGPDNSPTTTQPTTITQSTTGSTIP